MVCFQGKAMTASAVSLIVYSASESRTTTRGGGDPGTVCCHPSGGRHLYGHAQPQLGELYGGIENARPPLSRRRVERGPPPQHSQRIDLLLGERNDLADGVIEGVRQRHVERSSRGKERCRDLGVVAEFLDGLARILDLGQDLSLGGGHVWSPGHVEAQTAKSVDEGRRLLPARLDPVGKRGDHVDSIAGGVPDLLDEVIVALKEVDDA